MKPYVPEMTAEQLKKIPVEKIEHCKKLFAEFHDQNTSTDRMKEILLHFLYEDLLYDYADRYSLSFVLKHVLKKLHFRFLQQLKEIEPAEKTLRANLETFSWETFARLITS